MTVPTVATYSTEALTAANTSFKELIDAGLSAGSVKFRSADDVLLAQVPLSYPCGTVDAMTGQLTLTPDGREESAPASGTIAYGEFCDAAGVAHLSLPAQAGAAPVSGAIVVSNLLVPAGRPVQIVSAVIV